MGERVWVAGRSGRPEKRTDLIKGGLRLERRQIAERTEKWSIRTLAPRRLVGHAGRLMMSGKAKHAHHGNKTLGGQEAEEEERKAPSRWDGDEKSQKSRKKTRCVRIRDDREEKRSSVLVVFSCSKEGWITPELDSANDEGRAWRKGGTLKEKTKAKIRTRATWGSPSHGGLARGEDPCSSSAARDVCIYACRYFAATPPAKSYLEIDTGGFMRGL